MIFSYINYKWENPKTGDEYLYFWWKSSEYTFKNSKHTNDEKIFLCIDPPIHPIKKHPLGFVGITSLILTFLIGSLDIIVTHSDIYFYLFCVFFIGVITGGVSSFGTYVPYFLKEKKWKRKVILDWKNDKLKYKHKESILSKCKPLGELQDEEKFF